MGKFLKIWSPKAHKGGKTVEVVERDQVRGVVVEQQNVLKTKRYILITGAHHSGKSHMIMSLMEEAEGIWSVQCRPYAYSNNRGPDFGNKPMLQKGESREDWVFPEPLFLSMFKPLSQWCDHQGIAKWWDSKEPDVPYQKLKAHQKVDILSRYLSETQAVLFVDDAHKASARKAQVLKECVCAAFRCVLTAEHENRITPSVRQVLMEAEPQIIRLDTDVAYDATNIFMLLLMCGIMLAGSPELAVMLLVLQTMAGGRNAGRQD
ncbi:MAG: hypothetical protein AAF512_17670 [Pseudomonadota bacterium]